MIALVGILLIGVAISTSTENEAMSVEDKRIEELLKTPTGQYALAMAELSAMTGGPYDSLIEGIQYIVEDLEVQKATQAEAFGQRIKDHQSEVVFLNDIISRANIDISTSTSLLNNALYPQREQNQRIIDNDNRSISETREYMDLMTKDREAGKSAYEARVAEKNGALSAVDQAVEIMERIVRGEVSFAENGQIIHAALRTASEKTKKLDPIDSEFIKSLINMDMQKFTNMEGAIRVRDLLRTIKQDIYDDLQLEHADEKKAQQVYDDDYRVKRSEVKRFERELLIVSAQLKVTNEWIDAKESYLALRT